MSQNQKNNNDHIVREIVFKFTFNTICMRYFMTKQEEATDTRQVTDILKVAAGSLDDIANQTAKSLSQTAGLLVDDTAAIPQYVSNTAAKRELPVIWKITKKSLINKLIIIPIAIGDCFILCCRQVICIRRRIIVVMLMHFDKA
jgi:hypothetical protein